MKATLLPRDYHPLIMGGVLLLALGSRFVLAISKPFIEDEYASAKAVDSVSLSAGHINIPLRAVDHPAGYVYWGALGTSVFGNSLLGYRIGQVLLGTLAVAVLYGIGREIFGKNVALLAASLLAANEYYLGQSYPCLPQISYLTFGLIALLLFERAHRGERPAGGLLAVSGAALGFGTFCKESLLLWLPLFALELCRRHFRPEPESTLPDRPPNSFWWGGMRGLALFLLAYFVMILPDVYWNFVSADKATLGFYNKAQNLAFEGWCWGPPALYLRPLYFYLLEPDQLSEFVSMTSLPGLILLAGAIASLFLLRSRQARFLQLLGWGPFVFYSLFSVSRGEFWWADLSVAPFILLTSAVIGRLAGAAGKLTVALILLVFVWRAGVLVLAIDNYHAPDWGKIPAAVVKEYRMHQASLIVQHRDRDHVALCRYGHWQLPATAYYRRCLTLYRSVLRFCHGESAGRVNSKKAAVMLRMYPRLDAAYRQAIPSPKRQVSVQHPLIQDVIQQELAWVNEELARF